MSSRSSDGGPSPGPLPPAKRPKTGSSSRVPVISWNDLQPELLGTVGTFVDVGSDLTSLCLVAGPNVSTTIRKSFLRDNDDYLRYLCTHAPSHISQLNEFANKIRRWMEANVDWKKRASLVARTRPLSAASAVIWTVKSKIALAMNFKLCLGHCIAYAGGMPDDVDLEIGSILMKIGDQDVGPNLSVEAVKSLIASSIEQSEDSRVDLGFTENQNVFFSDPVLAIKLGLSEVLKVLVEERGLGVNEFVDAFPNEERVSLLLLSLLYSPDKSAFNYLLSRSDIDCSMGCHTQYEDSTIAHEAALHKRNQGLNDVDVETFKSIVQHPTADANAIDGYGCTPLFVHVVCSRHRPTADGDIEMVKILLKAGADPLARNNFGQTPIDFLRIRLASAPDADTSTEENREQMQEMLTLLEEAVART